MERDSSWLFATQSSSQPKPLAAWLLGREQRLEAAGGVARRQVWWMVLHVVVAVWRIAPFVVDVSLRHSEKAEMLESREAQKDVVKCYEGVFWPFLSTELSVDEYHGAQRKRLDVVRILRSR